MSEETIRSAYVNLETRTETGHDRLSGLDEEMVALFDRTRDRLLRYSMSLGLTLCDGEEIIQEAFLALFHHLRRGRPKDNLRAWIFQVTHNLALKRRAGDQRTRQSLVEWGTRSWEGSLAPNPEDQLDERQRRVRMLGVWRALPEQERLCLALRGEGLTYREIAEVLTISLGAVSTSLSRSLARFARANQR